MGIEIIMIILSLLFRKFISPNSIIHRITPFSYIFTEEVLIDRYNANYIFGILLNLMQNERILKESFDTFLYKEEIGN